MASDAMWRSSWHTLASVLVTFWRRRPKRKPNLAMQHGRIEVIEINARFGGGYPVAHFAGANFIKCLLQEMHHEGLSDEALNWTPGTVMLRWDDAVFTTAEDIFTN